MEKLEEIFEKVLFSALRLLLWVFWNPGGFFLLNRAKGLPNVDLYFAQWWGYALKLAPLVLRGVIVAAHSQA